MFVSAAARRRGFARRLLTELEGRAAALGYTRVRLFTTGVLVEAQALYAATGYRVIDTIHDGGRIDIWLEKSLPPPAA